MNMYSAVITLVFNCIIVCIQHRIDSLSSQCGCLAVSEASNRHARGIPPGKQVSHDDDEKIGLDRPLVNLIKDHMRRLLQ